MELILNLNDERIQDYELTISEFVFLIAYENMKNLETVYDFFGKKGLKKDTVYRNYKRLREKGLIDLEIMKRGSNLYVVADEEKSVLKIGVANNINERIKKLRTGNHLNLEVIFEFNKLGHLEKEIHRRFSEFRLTGEWFKYDETIIKFFQDEIQYKH